MEVGVVQKKFEASLLEGDESWCPLKMTRNFVRIYFILATKLTELPT